MKATLIEFNADRVVKMSAALSYYTIFSLPSLLITIIGLCSIFYGKDAVEGEIFSQIDQYVGKDAALQIQEALQKTTLMHDNFLATAIGLGILLFSATGIFGEMQDSINAIWSLKAKPSQGFFKLLLDRLLSFSMILVLGFILLVSLLLNTIISGFMDILKERFSGSIVNGLIVIDYALMIVAVAALFASIFKVLPDAKIEWKDVIRGALVTSVFFFAGKFAIEYYLHQNTTVSAYGAAGYLILVLLWVYYSSLILYFGAEFTQVYTRFHGRKITPNKYAVWVEKSEIEKTSNVDIHRENLN